MSSKVIELSEHKTYIELTRRLCYYDYPNLNGVQLNSDTAEEKAQTLLMQPVVAKYKKFLNKDDLGGHECSVDAKGNVTFGTVPIGVNVAVKIKNDTVNINDNFVETPCLFATSRIWTRNKNVCSAIKRLFAEGKLHSSWEILTEKAEYIDNIKVLKDYVFEADALLGSTTNPAYGECATTLCVASSGDPELLLSEAVANDFNIENSETKEDNTLNTNENKTVVTSEIENTDVVASEVAETSQVTENVEAVNTNNVVSKNDKSDETETVQVDESNDSATANTVNKVVSDMDNEISVLKQKIAEKNDAIIKANEEIISLKADVENLTKYKEMFEKAEAEKAEKELAEKQENLKRYAIKSGYITSDEIDTSEEIKKLIDAVDENGIKAIIVDRLMAQKNDNDVIVSEAGTTATEIASLTCEDTSIDTSDYKSAMKKFLGK